MAKVGGLGLGGRGSGSGAAFQLSAPARLSYVYAPAGEPWEVEIREGETNIVARTPNSLGRSHVLAYGLEQVQRCLDLLSFGKRENLLTKRPGDDHIVLFLRDGAYVAQHVCVSALGIHMNMSVEIKDKDGNVSTANPRPPVWTPGLRFYRLSQSNTDLYDAYRSLWLGFEALLDIICPNQPVERERDWLLRALFQIGSSIDLRGFVPNNCSDPVAYIVGTQYDHIRCRLFHGKIAQASSRPDFPDPEEVASAYERLIRLWREIAERCLSVQSGGGGGMTDAGFKMMLDNALTNQLTMYFTDDPSPITKEDTEVSPMGRPVLPFSKVTYLSETAPGRVSFVGSQALAEIKVLPVVHRICSKAADVLLTGWCIEEGLCLDGTDYLESYQGFRLINRDLPRVVFGEDS
jgi:hypothetical protein